MNKLEWSERARAAARMIWPQAMSQPDGVSRVAGSVFVHVELPSHSSVTLEEMRRLAVLAGTDRIAAIACYGTRYPSEPGHITLTIGWVA